MYIHWNYLFLLLTTWAHVCWTCKFSDVKGFKKIELTFWQICIRKNSNIPAYRCCPRFRRIWVLGQHVMSCWNTLPRRHGHGIGPGMGDIDRSKRNYSFKPSGEFRFFRVWLKFRNSQFEILRWYLPLVGCTEDLVANFDLRNLDKWGSYDMDPHMVQISPYINQTSISRGDIFDEAVGTAMRCYEA